MEKHHLTRGLALTSLAAAVLASALASYPHDASAKHRKSQPQQSSSDPCAGPTGFVKQNIAKIRELQNSLEPRTDNLAGWIQHLQGTKNTDPAKLAKMSELRHDADGVNNLLRAGGCPMVDIDLELNPK
ncbi:hypothetical protein [Hyphomicrobium sp.]|uniref:hypothetical protein n=1 Tax=Hyphomicrobium sp. TaxID=82 RepID=UPI002D773185|nr:hypothetical protein [Hyphomicrobium sp.]HET6388079.1 hypothetical protein [Hyphomicrobium sp.]